MGTSRGLIHTESGTGFGSAAAGAAVPRQAITAIAGIARCHPRIVTEIPR
ncbi:hypothetical protein OKHIF_27190 [Mycobacteroides chelonae]